MTRRIMLALILLGLCQCVLAQFGDRREGVVTAVTLWPANGIISAHEPLIAIVTWTNKSEEPAQFTIGNNSLPSVQFEVLNAAGETVLATPKRAGAVLDEIQGLLRLEPGKSRSQYWIISTLHDFAQPGQYTLRVREFSAGKTVQPEHSLPLQVLPYDPVRLEEACEALFRPQAEQTKLPMGTASKALRSVRDDVVLPYLDRMARDGNRYACRAIRRLGTARAQQLLEALMALPGRAGEAVQASLAMPLEPTLWDATGDLQ